MWARDWKKTDISLVVDLYPLYPPSIRPAFLDQIRDFYIDTYQDKFFIDPPGWFRAYVVMEAVYHVPLSIWAIGALMRGELFSSSLSLPLASFSCA